MSDDKLITKFWSALRSDMTVMLGLAMVDEGHTRPMTAQFEDGETAIWFFTSTDNSIVQSLSQSNAGVMNFASKDHDLFACVHGAVARYDDLAVIDRLWNPYVAAWYTGKDDPKLALLRFDPADAEIWENASSVFAGLRMLLGSDPKKDYADKVAKVQLG